MTDYAQADRQQFLPTGGRTTDRAVAIEVAKRISKIIKRGHR